MPDNSSKEIKQGTSSFNLSKFIHEHKKTLLAMGLILIALCALLWFVLYNRADSDQIVLEVGESVVLKSEYTRLVDEAKESGIAESQSKEIIIDYLKNQIAAKEWDIDLLDIDTRSVSYNTANEFVDTEDQAQNSIATDMIISNDSEVFKMAKYSRAFEVQLYARAVDGMQVALYRVPNINNLDINGKQPLSQADIEVGRTRAESLRSSLAEGKVSTYDTLDKILQDPDYRMLGNTNGSGMFYYSKSNKMMTYLSGSKDNSNMGIVPHYEAVEYLDSVDSTGISDVLEQVMYDSRIDQDMLGSFFFVEVIRINSPEDGVTPESTKEEYTRFKNKIRVIDYEN